MLKSWLSFAALLLATPTLLANSYYTDLPKDAQAVVVTSTNFPVKADGIADDTDALQQAIDKAHDAHEAGVVFLPSGRYRLTKTLYIWPGVRLIGFGPTRPVLVLTENTPGFQSDPNNMVFFAGNRPGTRQWDGSTLSKATKPSDATPGTFYSALSNVDFEIGNGNPGAVAVRARYAQHCFLAHIDFHIGSGLAGIHDGGNFAEDLHFFGGRYGIWTRKPSPGWQFTVIDSTFEGQRESAIREHEAGLTLVRPQFKNVPTAIDIDATYPEELWIKDARFENISGPAIIISNEHNAHTEINAENVACKSVPKFALLRESGKIIAGKSDAYVVSTFSHGLHFASIDSSQKIETIFEAQSVQTLPPAVASDVPALPPMQSWANLRDLGAIGDGIADDTVALQAAIDAHRTIFLPQGQYRITNTITLKPDTVLIGLHPSLTRIFLTDHTPAFAGVGSPVPMLIAPKEGTNIIQGIGLYTNGINPRAVALKWMAGTNSLVNDVRFLGGHGTVDINPVLTPNPDTAPKPRQRSWGIYNNTHTADSDLERRWNGQYPSLWITDGGGGTFMDIWTPTTFAQAGMLISNTSTPGRVYELSSEHHVRNEIQIHNAANWQIYALQTEEERGEGGFALPLEITDSHDITIANYHSYRVVSMFQPFPYAIKVQNSQNIHFRNIHIYSDCKASFDDAVFSANDHLSIRNREFAGLDFSDENPGKKPANENKVEKVVDGFYNISGGAIAPNGDPYFVDAHWQTIYHWSDAKRQLIKLRDNPLDPVNLAFDKSGDLLVVSYQGNGTVYSFKPDSTDLNVEILKAQPSTARPGAKAILPVDFWRNENDFPTHIAETRPWQFLSPDGSVFISTGEDFVKGSLYYGIRMHDVLRAYGLAIAEPGKKFYVSDESQEKTFVVTVGDDGNLSDPKLFAEEGGESVAVDASGYVYLAAGEIYVYSPDGTLLRTIHVPARPQQLLFGGKNGTTLFILTREALYATEIK